MNILPLRYVSAGVFFLFIFPTGLWLSHAGRPYSLLLFNTHKLIGLGVFLFLTVNIFKGNREVPLSGPEQAACVIVGFLFLATIVTGGLVSTPKTMTGMIPLAHRLLPYLTAFSTVASLFLLFRHR